MEPLLTLGSVCVLVALVLVLFLFTLPKDHAGRGPLNFAIGLLAGCGAACLVVVVLNNYCN
jgi:hypothetical protein